MPMNEAFCVEVVFEPDAEKPAFFDEKSGKTVWLADAENGDRFAIDLNAAPDEPQHCRRGGGVLGARGGDRACRESSGQKIAARQHANLLPKKSQLERFQSTWYLNALLSLCLVAFS